MGRAGIIRTITAAGFIAALLALQPSAPALAQATLNYTYDANGNLVSGDGKHHEYNDANQLVRVRHVDANGPVIAEFFYDHTGQRIKKVEDGVTTYYVGKHFESQPQGTGLSNTSYYFANGERVAKRDAIGQISSVHSDHLGSTSVVTDAAGSAVERKNYFPFGVIRAGGSEKYAYTGKENDKATDLYYYEARFYSAQFAHFTQADSIAPSIYDPQDLNRFSYARNNPVRMIDPSGHNVFDSVKGRAVSLWSQAKNNIIKSWTDGMAIADKTKQMYEAIPKREKEFLQTQLSNTFVGDARDTYEIGKFFTNKVLGRPTKDKPNDVLTKVPLGVGWTIEGIERTWSDDIYSISGGKYGRPFTVVEQWGMIKRSPFGLGIGISVIASGIDYAISPEVAR